MSNLSDLFHDLLRDVYWAEKQLLKVLPKMAKNAASKELAKALTDHRAETEGQVERLEQVFDIIQKTPKGKKCEAMVGLTAEGDEVLEEVDDEVVRDIGIIASAQAVEHYEIARYGTLAAWARVLDHEDAAKLLEKTLSQEKAADAKLSRLSATINAQAELEAA